MRIYLDMCCFNRPYDDQSQLTVAMETQSKINIQNGIRNGKYELVGSYMLDYESNNVPNPMRKSAVKNFINDFMRVYVGVQRSTIIQDKVNEIMSTGVKEKDAIHVASAIYAKCDYFITTDRRLLKYKTPEIKMVNPIEFVLEEAYMDDPEHS